MKFNWGTGIFIFLAIFLLGSAAFIVFAFLQDVNLVHKDYYEKGVDYSDQMDVSKRSTEYINYFHTRLENDFLVIDFDEELALKLDSGSVLLYRPSSSKNDLKFALTKEDNALFIPKQDLIQGRYILKLYWYSDGLKYELDKPVNIQ